MSHLMRWYHQDDWGDLIVWLVNILRKNGTIIEYDDERNLNQKF